MDYQYAWFEKSADLELTESSLTSDLKVAFFGLFLEKLRNWLLMIL